jgi:hypothetical protein
MMRRMQFLVGGLLVTVLIPGLAVAQGKPAPHNPATITGRVVDAVCLLSAGLSGESHRECAIGCDKAGVRMYLLDEKQNQMYAVMADAPFKDPNALIRPHLEQVVTVKGDLYEAPGGLKVIAVKEVSP